MLENLSGGDTAPPPDLIGASFTDGIGIRPIVHARDFGFALCGLGATQAQTFTRILLPLMRPVLAVIFFITFMGIYGEYILASFILQDLGQKTLPVGLQLFVQSDYAAKWGNLGAAAVLGALPVIAVFFPLQKQLIAGLTGGAVKG